MKRALITGMLPPPGGRRAVRASGRARELLG